MRSANQPLRQTGVPSGQSLKPMQFAIVLDPPGNKPDEENRQRFCILWRRNDGTLRAQYFHSVRKEHRNSFVRQGYRERRL